MLYISSPTGVLPPTTVPATPLVKPAMLVAVNAPGVPFWKMYEWLGSAFKVIVVLAVVKAVAQMYATTERPFPAIVEYPIGRYALPWSSVHVPAAPPAAPKSE